LAQNFHYDNIKDKYSKEAIVFSNLTSSHRLVVLILALSISTVIISSLLLPTIVVILIAILIFSLLWLIRPLMMPPGAGATKVRLISLFGTFTLAGTHSLWADVVNSSAKALVSYPPVERLAPWLSKFELSTEPSSTVLVFVAIIVLIVNYFMAEKTIGGDHPVPIKKDFPEPSFQMKLKSFCSALRQHLETTDRQANWSPDYYTELEAEVEIVPLNGISGKKKIINLQSALRSDNKTQAFLILGEPGGGKSVALRKLARDMLAEVERTGRIPLYINLREWLPSKGRSNSAWTEQNPPHIQELENFVIENIKSRGDVFTEDFVDNYFRDLWQNGRLFFIFDSFDEIPELLDVSEESWLIENLSELLSRFISSNINARGVLASRMFRRPTQEFLAQKILDIRPMSEDRIRLALARYPAFTQKLQTELFRDRHDLITIARNPFLMALLGEWVNINRVLPRSQAELYTNYLNSRLSKARVKIDKCNLTIDKVLESATQIANFVFESPSYGLEAPVSVLEDELTITNAIEVIDILSYARIARVTTGDAISFAFVHRRFLEYLVTTKFLATPEDLPLDHIPTDSRGRDAMVLYAQLCDDVSAEKLAVLCWEEICKHFENPEKRLRAIHCLRFLTDAFRSRQTAVGSFADELALFIDRHVNKFDNLIQAKLCLEATGLLKDTAALPILQEAMSRPNLWLRETAFRACRHLPKLSAELQQLIDAYITNMPAYQFWHNRRTLIFSLSLSDALKKTHKIALWRKRNLVASVIGIIIGAALTPRLCITSLLGLTGIVVIDHIANPNFNDRTSGLQDKIGALTIFKLTTNYFFRAYQHVFGLSLFIAVLASQSKQLEFLISKNDAHAFSKDYADSLILTTLAFTAAFLCFDWLWMGFLKRLFKRLLGLSSAKRIKTVSVGIIAVLVFLLLSAGVTWLIEQIPSWLKDIFILITTMLIVACGGILGIFTISLYLKNWKKYKNIVITSRMERKEIAEAILSLEISHLRLALVRKLAENKTVVIGEWPANFELSMSGDISITELAKLEERWLKLDR
jgi:hypothetical protein